MNRRELLLGAAAMAAAATTGRVFAAEPDAHAHHHNMSTRNTGLIEAASDCRAQSADMLAALSGAVGPRR
ncbi:MAG: hypothetical protein FD173_1487 [Gallionellaceae bacterium]|nr:MAG: hypothetical protein FD173_1487 [Gallionellaceae bacterium]